VRIKRPHPDGFSIDDTQFAKGIAISLILVHHLFYQTLAYGKVTNEVALMSKMAVAIFVFLSGFGVYRSYRKSQAPLGQYYLQRLKRIYLPFWIAWVVFVPSGVFFFGRTLSSVYGHDIGIRLVENVLGIQMFFGFYGYNPTWWFVSLILGLYLISPVVFYLLDRLGVVALFLAALTILVPFEFRFWFITIYIFPFVLGAYTSRENLIKKLVSIGQGQKWLKLILYLAMTAVLFWQRQAGIFKGVVPDAPTSIDAVLSLLIVLLCFEYLGKIQFLYGAFRFVGKHAYYIFLIHTFIFYLYFRDFVYSFNYAPVVFGVLLGISLVLSMGLQWVQEMLQRMINKIIMKGRPVIVNML